MPKSCELAKNANKYSVGIPTTSHLCKFLLVEYGNPVKIDNSTLIGTVIISLLGKASFHVSMNPLQKKQQSGTYTSTLTCQAPISLMKDYGHSITMDQAIQMNRFFERFFFEKLYLFVQHRVDKHKRNMGVQEAILDFCSFYEIDTEREISYDALKKAEYRFRKKQKKSFDILSSQNRV